MRARDARVRELLDADSWNDQDLRRNLGNIRRINRLLGWTQFTSKTVLARVRAAGLHEFSLLDVASGSADIPAAIARQAQRRGIAHHLVATDVSPQIVAVAREYTADLPGIHVERQDALALPYASGSFDFGLCTLALHHFDPDVAVELLRNLGRVSRRVLVFDVVRSRAAYLGARLLTQVARMDAMTRHDAPASVRRAYTAGELRALAWRAGLRDARVWVGFPYRLALEAPGEA